MFVNTYCGCGWNLELSPNSYSRRNWSSSSGHANCGGHGSILWVWLCQLTRYTFRRIRSPLLLRLLHCRKHWHYLGQWTITLPGLDSSVNFITSTLKNRMDMILFVLTLIWIEWKNVTLQLENMLKYAILIYDHLLLLSTCQITTKYISYYHTNHLI